MFCTKCGMEQRSNPKFCRNCGDSIRQTGNQQASSVITGSKSVITSFFTLALIIVVLAGMIFAAKSVLIASAEQRLAESVARAVVPEVPLYGEGRLCGVIIGIGDYSHIDDLYISDDAAEQMYKQFEILWGEGARLKLLLNSDATRNGIEEAMNWLASEEDAEDTVLFYFTGHGDKEYIAPYDSLTNSYSNDISTSQLDRWLDALDSEKIVVFIDSCYSGAFGQYLSQNGRVIMSSCANNEVAYGELSNYLIQAFSNPLETDANNNQEISVEEIYASVANQDMRGQHPLLYDSNPNELVLVSIANE